MMFTMLAALWLLGSARLLFRWLNDDYDAPEGWWILVAIILALLIGPTGLFI